ncbi:MAG: nodulation protein NfeD, partial [Rhodothermales bacterium]|nr:nodulation protein NfeD [Rhodothermales bacterium]
MRLASLILLMLAVVQPSRAQSAAYTWIPVLPEGPVYVVPVEGMIDNGLAAYLDRALADAAEADAAAVIFHVDTFGGLVDAADKIRKSILDAEMVTIAFIDKNAASAGALISYAADRIVMVPGASMGAATVVQGTGGEAAPDKYQSYMRGLMRSTAEANGKDPDIAEAMVDENLDVPGVSPAGEVLTLSATEALDLGVADAIIDNLDRLMEALEVTGERVFNHNATRLEAVLRFFGSPVVQSILMLMMLGGLYFELQTPGVGFPGLMALIGATLSFGPHYVLGLVESWELVLFILGIALLLVELFVFPGFGVAGLSGLVLVVFSLAVSLIGNVGLNFPSVEQVGAAIWTLAITMAILVALMMLAARWLPQSTRFNQLVLAPELGSAAGFTSAPTDSTLVGKIGKALTTLRPAGIAMIDDRRIDVMTAGEYIEAGTTIRVVGAKGSRVE